MNDNSDLILTRYAYFSSFTAGELVLPNGARMYTLERPWDHNKPFVSCIPDGSYELEWDRTGRIRDVPRLRDVPGRTQINIHAANYVYQLHGCIGVGTDIVYDEYGGAKLANSRDAMALLLEFLGPVGKDQEDIKWQGQQMRIFITPKRAV